MWRGMRSCYFCNIPYIYYSRLTWFSDMVRSPNVEERDLGTLIIDVATLDTTSVQQVDILSNDQYTFTATKTGVQVCCLGDSCVHVV